MIAAGNITLISLDVTSLDVNAYDFDSIIAITSIDEISELVPYKAGVMILLGSSTLFPPFEEGIVYESTVENLVTFNVDDWRPVLTKNNLNSTLVSAISNITDLKAIQDGNIVIHSSPKVEGNMLEDITESIDYGTFAEAITSQVSYGDFSSEVLVTKDYGSLHAEVLNYGDYWLDPESDPLLTGYYDVYFWDESEWVRSNNALSKAISDTYASTLKLDEVEALADSKVKIWYQETAPELNNSTDLGDLWVDTDNNNITKVWQGSSVGWVDQSSQATQDITDFVNTTIQNSIDELKEQTDGVITGYRQETDPKVDWTTDSLRRDHHRDVWFDTSVDPVEPKRYDYQTNSWFPATDIEDTLLDANAYADGKASIYYGTEANRISTGSGWTVDEKLNNIGDVWYQDPDVNGVSGKTTQYRWSGAAWFELQDGVSFANSEEITTLKADINTAEGQISGLTTNYNTLSGTVNGNYSNIQSAFGYTSNLEVNGNNYITGFSLNSSMESDGTVTSTSSEFVVSADTFKLVDPLQSATALAPFEVDTATGETTFRGKVTFGGSAKVLENTKTEFKDDMEYSSEAELKSYWKAVTGSSYGRSTVEEDGEWGLWTDDTVWLEHTNRVAFDKTKLYRITCSARKLSSTEPDSDTAIGIVCYGGDGETKLNTDGNDLYSSSHYISAENQILGDTYTKYVGYFKGESLIGVGDVHRNPGDPATLYQGTKFFSPLIVANGSVTSKSRFDNFEIEVVDSSKSVDDTLLVWEGSNYINTTTEYDYLFNPNGFEGLGFVSIKVLDADGGVSVDRMEGTTRTTLATIGDASTNNVTRWFTFPIEVTSATTGIKVYESGSDHVYIYSVVVTVGGAGDPQAVLEALEAKSTADGKIGPGDNISELTNDSGFTDDTVANSKWTYNQATIDSRVDNGITTLEDSLGGVAYVDVVETSKLGTSVLEGGYLKTSLIEAGTIVAGSVAANWVYAGTVNADNITSGTITGRNITGGTVTANTVKSSTYVTDTSGWQLNSDGSAQFNNIVASDSNMAASGTTTVTENKRYWWSDSNGYWADNVYTYDGSPSNLGVWREIEISTGYSSFSEVNDVAMSFVGSATISSGSADGSASGDIVDWETRVTLTRRVRHSVSGTTGAVGGLIHLIVEYRPRNRYNTGIDGVRATQVTWALKRVV